MARIRTIKPEFPQSETIGALSRDARLLFIQLWTIADDEGRARAASRMLASLLYPYDTDAPKLIDRWLEELEEHNCIRRYEVDGSKYLDIPNWLKHQKIDRPTKSRLPEFASPREDSRVIVEPSSTDLGPSTLDLGPRTVDHIRAVAVATRPADDPFEDFWKSYPRRDGANPKAPARKKFLAAVKSGADPQTIIAGARRYAAECQSKQQIGTPYVAQAITWLNQQRWGDYQPSVSARPNEPPAGAQSDAELRAKYEALRERNNRSAAPNGDDANDRPKDNPGDVLGSRPGEDRANGRERSGNPPRDAGARSVGELLRAIPALDAVVSESTVERQGSGDNDADTVAGVVRH